MFGAMETYQTITDIGWIRLGIVLIDVLGVIAVVRLWTVIAALRSAALSRRAVSRRTRLYAGRGGYPPLRRPYADSGIS